LQNRTVLLFFLLMASLTALAAGGRKVTHQDSAPPASKLAEQATLRGQRVFEQQCARCHNAPEGFSQGISGTIIRHMRVRASLSHGEEEDLLRFFNP
jgi:mono/diheme cytochrome c family protein